MRRRNCKQGRFSLICCLNFNGQSLGRHDSHHRFSSTHSRWGADTIRMQNALTNGSRDRGAWTTDHSAVFRLPIQSHLLNEATMIHVGTQETPIELTRCWFPEHILIFSISNSDRSVSLDFASLFRYYYRSSSYLTSVEMAAPPWNVPFNLVCSVFGISVCSLLVCFYFYSHDIMTAVDVIYHRFFSNVILLMIEWPSQ
jgi:hypothetical protein